MTSLHDVAELVRKNYGLQRRELDEARDTLVKAQIEHEQQLMHQQKESQDIVE